MAAPKSVIKLARDQLLKYGDYITLVKISRTNCSDCVLGPDGESIEDCDTCGGSGYIETEKYYRMKAIVAWESYNTLDMSTTKVLERGECEIAINYNDYRLIDATSNDYFIIDNKKLLIEDINVSSMDLVKIILTRVFDE